MKNQRNTFFNNIKSWLYNIFHKSKKLNECLIKQEDTEECESVSNKFQEKNSFDEYKKKAERHNYLLQLQKKFENKDILESEINEIDKADLVALYIEQIKNLKRDIRIIENKIRKLN